MKTTTTTKKATTSGNIISMQDAIRKNVQVFHWQELVPKDHVRVKFSVPAAVAKLLQPKKEYCARIQSAVVSSISDVDHRARGWSAYQSGFRPRKDYLAEILKQPLDTVITAYFSGQEWELVQKLCKRLKIPTGDWLLASAFYNAECLAKFEKAGRTMGSC